MNIDPEVFKNMAAGAQSIAVIFALMVGGCWALLRLFIMREHKKYPAPELTILATQEALPADSNYYISAIVQIKNNGHRPATFPFRESPFTVTPVIWDDSEHPHFGSVIKALFVTNPEGEKLRPVGTVVRPGEKTDVPFFVRVPSPGLYWLNFETKMKRVDRAAHRESGFWLTSDVWVAKKFFVVHPDEAANQASHAPSEPAPGAASSAREG